MPHWSCVPCFWSDSLLCLLLLKPEISRCRSELANVRPQFAWWRRRKRVENTEPGRCCSGEDCSDYGWHRATLVGRRLGNSAPAVPPLSKRTDLSRHPRHERSL